MTPPTIISPIKCGPKSKHKDYTFRGYVVALFNKRNGVVRAVVENNDRILHIFNPGNLRRIPEEQIRPYPHDP